jgi:ubiquinone/menaquinone biosynthesis C-methylase UbiE
MVGPKAGDRIVVVGATDPDLAAEIALVTGLNGTTTVCDPDPAARERVDAAAAKAGALVEFQETSGPSLPVDDASHDVVVLLAGRSSDAPRLDLEEPLRVLRSGGRIVIVDGVRTTGLFKPRSVAPRLEKDDVLQALDRAGTRARRQLADVDGVAYYEARK